MKKIIILVVGSIIAFLVNIMISFHFYNLVLEILSRFLLNGCIFLLVGYLVHVKTDKFEKSLVVLTSFLLVFAFARPALATDVFNERYKDFSSFKNLENAWTTVSVNHSNNTVVFTNFESGTYEETHEISSKDPLYLKGDFANFDELVEMGNLDIYYRMDDNEFYAMYEDSGFNIYFYGLSEDKTEEDWLKEVVLK